MIKLWHGNLFRITDPFLAEYPDDQYYGKRSHVKRFMQRHELNNCLVDVDVSTNNASFCIMSTVSPAFINDSSLFSLCGFTNYVKSFRFAISNYGALKQGDY